MVMKPSTVKHRTKSGNSRPLVIELLLSPPAFAFIAALIFAITWSDEITKPIEPQLKELVTDIDSIQHDLMMKVTQLKNTLKQFIAISVRPHSEGLIGWLQRNFTKHKPSNYVTDRFMTLYNDASLHLTDLIPPEYKKFTYVLVPGLFTRWYPGYMKRTTHVFNTLGLDIRVAPINTDAGVLTNAKTLYDYLLELNRTGINGVILIGHSKGAVDAAASVSLYPDIRKFIKGLISLQAPYGGATLVHDFLQEKHSKWLATNVVELMMGGDFQALVDLTYSARMEFIAQNPYPVDEIPTISLASSAEEMPRSLLAASIEYVKLRYNELSDGCVSVEDAIVPGSDVVRLRDMDHFGPGWWGFPSLGVYDPARMKLVLIRLLVEKIE